MSPFSEAQQKSGFDVGFGVAPMRTTVKFDPEALIASCIVAEQDR